MKWLDAGSWFDSRLKGVQIPTLAEVLDDIDTGKILLNLEIKPGDLAIRSPLNEIEQRLIKIIKKRNIMPFVLVTSFDPGVPTMGC